MSGGNRKSQVNPKFFSKFKNWRQNSLCKSCNCLLYAYSVTCGGSFLIEAKVEKHMQVNKEKESLDVCLANKFSLVLKAFALVYFFAQNDLAHVLIVWC